MAEDSRFAHVATDPKFRRIPKAERKVKVDKRFKSMFKSKQFKVKYTVDKRGRPVNQTSNEDLKRYYELSSADEQSDEEDNTNKTDARTQKKKNKEVKESTTLKEEVQIDEALKNDHFSDVDVAPDIKPITEKIKKKLRNLNIDYARGEGTLLSESSSDDESSGAEDEDSSDVEHAWGELDHDAEHTEEVSNRLAVCNMDWDRIKAIDLMVLLSSFLPAGGLILSVKIYPSEFGLQRMKEEEIKGPTELTEQDSQEDGGDGEEGSKYHMEKLRQYQLKRLKYYYAVVTFDSENSANKIYSECDGLEYESSATKMDLRFIPNGMDFDQEPKEVCNKLPEPNKYQPRFFTTTALQQVKVDLTWDETNPDRIEMTQKLASGKIDDVTDGDLHAYLASSSEEDNEQQEEADHNTDDDNKKSLLDKYKLLLEGINEQENAKKNKDVELEITWGIDLKEKTEKMVKQKLQDKEEKTPFQKYLEKRKEKRKLKKSKKQNSESDSDIPSDIDINDPYFAEEFTNVKTKKKPKAQDESQDDPQTNAELELLLLNQQDNKKHFSLQKIQERENNTNSKKRSKDVNDEQDDDFEVNVVDPRFSALYSSHHFNLDPTDSHYKKTKGMEAIKSEKLKRRNLEGANSEEAHVPQEHKKHAELNVLVKSVKRKTEALGSNKRKKKF